MVFYESRMEDIRGKQEWKVGIVRKGDRSMTRRDLELKAKKNLEEHGYRVERAVSKAVFIHGKFMAVSFDFFNCFDLIAVSDMDIRFVQVTSSDEKEEDSRSLRMHKKKINDKWPFNRPEIWHYRKEGNKWALRQFIRLDGKWVKHNVD
jgi:hypothetical protein